VNSNMTRAEELLGQAEALLQERNLAAALHGFEAAEDAGADLAGCAGCRWLVHMLRDDFEAAWRESDRIRASGFPDPHRFWQGEEFAGKRLIVRCLHGFGDAVQFLRYAPALRERADRLIVEVPPALFELAAMFDGVDEVITWGERAPAQPPEWDVQMEINELPYVFRTIGSELPLSVSYLRLRRAVKQESRPVARKQESLRVGVVWGSGDWNASRSVPLDLLRGALRTPGCEFWNLQGGAQRQEWSGVQDCGQLHAAAVCESSIPHLAGLIEQLDLVVTPDTLAAHLAGALGTPAWVMLEHAADWRWQHKRSDSPWYPSLRLFRQHTPGDWQSVVTQIGEALRAQANARIKEEFIA
jgi:hypothetical protein